MGKSRSRQRRTGKLTLKATYDSGVSVAEMDMTARGKVAADSVGNLAIQVAPNQSFAITPNELSRSLESLAGAQTVVTVRGQLYKKPAGRKKAEPSTPQNSSSSKSRRRNKCIPERPSASGRPRHAQAVYGNERTVSRLASLGRRERSHSVSNRTESGTMA
jgi:hypothetical protein